MKKATKSAVFAIALLCAVLMGGASSRAWANNIPPPVFYDFNGFFGSQLVTDQLILAQNDVVGGETVPINALTSDFIFGITNGVFSPFVSFGGSDDGPPPIVGAQFRNGLKTFNFSVGSVGSTSLWSVAQDSDGAIIASGTGGFSASAIPEPSTILLLSSGLLGLAGYRWLQRRRERAQVG